MAVGLVARDERHFFILPGPPCRDFLGRDPLSQVCMR